MHSSSSAVCRTITHQCAAVRNKIYPHARGVQNVYTIACKTMSPDHKTGLRAELFEASFHDRVDVVVIARVYGVKRNESRWRASACECHHNRVRTTQMCVCSRGRFNGTAHNKTLDWDHCAAQEHKYRGKKQKTCSLSEHRYYKKNLLVYSHAAMFAMKTLYGIIW